MKRNAPLNQAKTITPHGVCHPDSQVSLRLSHLPAVLFVPCTSPKVILLGTGVGAYGSVCLWSTPCSQVYFQLLQSHRLHTASGFSSIVSLLICSLFRRGAGHLLHSCPERLFSCTSHKSQSNSPTTSIPSPWCLLELPAIWTPAGPSESCLSISGVTH